jgi:3-hydroxyisobutyrate dehydrogenase-like beta-hydroxyacid dehydrogenase
MKKVAVLGLGIVGSRVRERLIKAGYLVTCWSRTQRGLAGEKNTPREALEGAELVSIYLKDAPMVREVFEKAKSSLTRGVTVLNHATIDLTTTLWLAEQCVAKGCDFIDAPFTGSKDASATGQLLYYTAGDAELVESLSNFLAVTSKGRIHCGKIGAATVIKLATNLISACTMQAMSEALAIAARHGVSPEIFTEAAIRNASGSPLMAMKYPGILKGDFEPHFTMANMWKDSRYALTLAETAGVHLPAITAVSARMGEMCAEGSGELDYSALAKAYEGL